MVSFTTTDNRRLSFRRATSTFDGNPTITRLDQLNADKKIKLEQQQIEFAANLLRLETKFCSNLSLK